MELDSEYFNNYYTNFSSLDFYINSSELFDEEISEYNNLWCLMAKIIDVLYRDDNKKILNANKYLFSFILILVEKFTNTPNKKEIFDNEKQLLENIIKFIISHYKEKLSLTEISDYLHLNPQYISRYFSKHMGSTLNEFIRNIRLQESIKDLKDKNKQITYIALEHGFPNSKSYFKAFKEIYGITPLKYRNIHIDKNPQEESFRELNYEDTFKKIFSFLNHQNNQIEVKVDTSIFNGGTGFIMRNGLKKPIYYAYELLNKLGSNVVEKGDNFIITKKPDGSFQILTYNYCDFKNNYINCSPPEVTFYDRYNVFTENVINISFALKGFNGQALKKTYKLNKENGSVYDEYIRMGAPKHLTIDEINYLNRKVIPEYKIQEINIGDNYAINEKLQPHEVLLIEIIPILDTTNQLIVF